VRAHSTDSSAGLPDQTRVLPCLTLCRKLGTAAQAVIHRRICYTESYRPLQRLLLYLSTRPEMAKDVRQLTLKHDEDYLMDRWDGGKFHIHLNEIRIDSFDAENEDRQVDWANGVAYQACLLPLLLLLSNLRRLELQFFLECQLEDCVQAIARMPNLKHFSYCGDVSIPLGDDVHCHPTWEELAEALTPSRLHRCVLRSIEPDFHPLPFPNLACLNLVELVGLSDENLKSLVQQTSKGLTLLSIFRCYDLTVQAIVIIQQECPNLTELRLEFDEGSFDPIECPAHYLTAFPKLRHLSLYGGVLNRYILASLTVPLKSLHLGRSHIAAGWVILCLVKQRTLWSGRASKAPLHIVLEDFYDWPSEDWEMMSARSSSLSPSPALTIRLGAHSSSGIRL
jgi:hypothetical protein